MGEVKYVQLSRPARCTGMLGVMGATLLKTNIDNKLVVACSERITSAKAQDALRFLVGFATCSSNCICHPTMDKVTCPISDFTRRDARSSFFRPSSGCYSTSESPRLLQHSTRGRRSARHFPKQTRKLVNGAYDVTWEGHDFLQAIRVDDNWQRQENSSGLRQTTVHRDGKSRGSHPVWARLSGAKCQSIVIYHSSRASSPWVLLRGLCLASPAGGAISLARSCLHSAGCL